MKRVLVGVAAVWLAGPAMAALECRYYDEMVAEAIMVMQVTPTEVIPPEGGGQGMCTLIGEIVRSFKGPHPVGTVIRTEIPCEAPLAPGRSPDIEIGPRIWWDYEALAAAAVVELHTQPEGGPAGYGAGLAILDAPTDAPAWRSFCE